MSFPRYPEYKDSGVEWLGEVPAHWVTCGLGHRLAQQPCYGVLVPDFEIDGVPMLRILDIDRGIVVRDSVTTISKALSAQYERTIIEANDVVLSVVGTIGECFVVGEQLAGVNLSRALARIVPGSGVTAHWLKWIFNSPNFERYVDLVCVGSAQRVLNMDDLRAFRIPCPWPTEQTAIAAFLDRETAKIDALVAEQETLIALLKEKRQAVISHAVTKGLNPDAPMKPSGIEWLGDVPAHWEITKASHLFRAQKGTNAAQLTKEYCAQEEGDFPVYSGQTENDGIMGTINSFEFDAGQDGALLSTTVGAKAMSVIHIMGRFSLSQNCMVILRKNESSCVRFWLYQLKTQFQFERGLIPDHMQPSFRMEDFYYYRLAAPPTIEQKDIAAYLDKECEKIDVLTKQASMAISLLKERRVAVISSAVTGQIDVQRLAE